MASASAQRLDSRAVSRAQRLSFLGIAVLIAVVAAIVLGSSGGDDEQAGTNAPATATATPSASTAPAPGATGTPTPTRAPGPPLVTPGKVTRLRFTEGDTVRFRVRADTADEVHVHGYDLMREVEPGRTVTIFFPADITGIFEIELETAGEQIAQLRVDPR